MWMRQLSNGGVLEIAARTRTSYVPIFSHRALLMSAVIQPFPWSAFLNADLRMGLKQCVL